MMIILKNLPHIEFKKKKKSFAIKHVKYSFFQIVQLFYYQSVKNK